ncbi:MAG TPA: ammonium transporter [Nitrospirota bacterium]|nr:ammonium transporter [Nitrospirota bacterium]
MNSSILVVMGTLICAFLVIFMQAGFAMMETGFTRAKNAGHSMAMNMMVFVFGVLGYWICGHAVRTGGSGFFLTNVASDASIIVLFLSQVVYLNIAATIPTGAMAERWTFKSFVAYGFFIAMFVYPLYANWVWSGGWLAQLGRNFGLGHGVLDFAGSSVVHMVGGVAGLAGAMVLGPRMGKYRANGTPVAIPGHHIPMAVVGCLILFFGWFGFNAGPAMADGGLRLGVIAGNTMLAGVAAAVAAMCYVWFMYGKPDLSLIANGLLGGLVAISGPCAFVSPLGAIMIGFAAGVLCCASVFFVERKLKVDDPVGAISVHGICGAWGMISLGLFADGTYGNGLNNVSGMVRGLLYGGGTQLVAQIIGVVVNFVFVFSVMYLFFKLLDRIIPMRVSEEVEFEGLDQSEVAVTAYPDFSITKTRR